MEGQAEAVEKALIPAPEPGGREALVAPNALEARLPVELDVAVPLPNFRVRNLLELAPGVVIESEWGQGDDLPLACGEVQLAWTEFEVIDGKLAVRLTRLA